MRLGQHGDFAFGRPDNHSSLGMMSFLAHSHGILSLSRLLVHAITKECYEYLVITIATIPTVALATCLTRPFSIQRLFVNMNAPRDADMVALEEMLSTFGKEPELMTGVVEPHRSWSSSSVSTLQGSSHPLSASGLDVEAPIELAVRQGFQSQQDANNLEALPPYHRLQMSKYWPRLGTISSTCTEDYSRSCF